jgi:PAS domain S-box-containing protein
VISFLFLAAAVVGFIWHDLRAEYLNTLAYVNVQLSDSADDRVRISALWLNERRTDTMVVAENSGTVRLLSGGNSGREEAEIQLGVEREIARIAALNGFLGGAVGDRDCRIVAQTGLRQEMAQAVREACQEVSQAREYQVDTFGMEQGHLWLRLSAPVMAESRASSSAPPFRRTVGSVIMVTDNWLGIIPTSPSVSVPKGASETFLVWKKAGEAQIFSPRLSTFGVQSFFRRPLNRESFESRVALDGDVAFAEFIDYRGQAIFGVARPTGAPGYSLAREVNRGEALSEYYRHRALDGLVGALSLLFLGSLLVTQHRHAAARDSEERARQEEALRERERRYKVLFESAADGIVLMRDEQIVDCNHKALELFGCGREELIGNAPSDFSPPQQPNGANSREEGREKGRLAQEGQTLHFEWRHLRGDGTPFEAEVTLSRLEIAGEAHVLALIRDVTEQRRAKEELADRLRFETLLADLSARFVNVPAEQLHGEIDTALRRVCECLGLEVSTLWQASAENPSFVTLTHTYRPPDAPPFPEHMDGQELFPWCYQQFMFEGRNVLILPSLEKMPPEAARDQESWRQLGVKSALIILLRVGGEAPIGVLTFNMMRGERAWPDGIVNRLQLAAQMFSSALARQRSDRALQVSEERYRRLFEDSPIGIAILGVNREIILTNKCYRDFLGLTEAEIIKRGPVGLLHPDDWGHSMALSTKLRSREIPLFHMEQRYIRGDGTVAWADTHIIALWDKDGRLLHTIGWVQDITERKQAEQALQASETRFRTLMEKAPVAISISRTGQTLYANQRYLEMYGFQKVDEIVGHSVSEQWAPGYRPMIEERARLRARGLPVPSQYEAMGQRRDGSEFPVEIVVAPVVLPDGSASIGFLMDITERKRTQEERQRSLEQLRALTARLQSIREDERKSLAREIHDQLGQALTAIKLDLSSLVSELPNGTPPPSKRASSIIKLVDETIQSVRRISTELRPGMLDDLGLVATVEWAGEDFEARTGIKCRLDLPPEDLDVDPDQATAIFRILQETLTNVVRHARASKVEVRLAREDGVLTLEVHDNGQGIPDDKLSSGKSLGILGMRERALLLGGETTICGSSGNGTTVRVRIPEAVTRKGARP